MKQNRVLTAMVFTASALSAGLLAPQASAGALFETRNLTVETATKAAQAALAACREAGYQVGVAVVDRAGVPQVFLRDRFGGAHTVGMAIDKAWTAASFRIPTSELGRETQAGKEMSGIRDLPRVIAAGGGVPIESAGSTVGAIAVSGAPGGDADEACAQAGIDAIQFDIEL
ncbi:MAG TPA: heme-binding protein [Burkholderiaceae bacterium]|nr:heme-binding protein [Burkholderiaceae bacterium]